MEGGKTGGTPLHGGWVKVREEHILTGVRYLMSYEEKPQRLSYYKIRDKKTSLGFM